MKFYHLTGFPPYYTNCFLLISDNKRAVAVDADAPVSDYTDILKKENAKLEYILLTHGHSDHISNLEPLVKATGAKVYIGRKDAELFGIKADEYYSDNEDIKLDELSVNVTEVPGHTPGSVCLRCGNIMFTGDTLFDGDIGRTDLKGGSYTDIIASLKKLCEKTTDNPDIYPGHESFSNMETQRKYNRYLAF